MLFPKPSKKPKQKRNREYDQEYLAWIHEWPCVVPGCTSKHPVHAHHVVGRGKLGSDRTCIPVCPHHHLDWIHTKGIKTSESAWGINLMDFVSEFNDKYARGESGPYPSSNRKKYQAF